MRLKNQVKLSAEDQELLRQFVSKGKEKVRKTMRCRILLLAHEGKTHTYIIETLKVARNTVRQVCLRYVQEGLDSAIDEHSRAGAPKKFTEDQINKITAIACTEPPEGRRRWTLRLIADKVVELKIVDDISHQTVKRILKKMNLSI